MIWEIAILIITDFGFFIMGMLAMHLLRKSIDTSKHR